MHILIGGQKEYTYNYERALQSLGAVPHVLLPDPLQIATFPLCSFQGLVLPGGGDIYPGFFGQTNLGSTNIQPRLDLQQLALFSAFFRAGKPVLGICKGMQIINVALGGTIVQDLDEPLKKIHAYQNTDQIHETQILPGTYLYQLYGGSLTTNSAHHQAIGHLGQDLLPAQYGPGNILEGLFHKTRPILGIQWHPERMLKNPETGDGSQVLSYFLSLCRS